MHHIVLDLFQFLVVIAVILWVVAFLVSWAMGRLNQLLTWTGNVLQSVWRHAWQLIVGIAAGYWLSGQPFLHVSW